MVTILFLGANPSDTNRLAIDEESRTIEMAIRGTGFGNYFDFRQHLAARPQDLQSLLLRYKPDIVHFSGHGTKDSIIFEDDNRQSFPISSESLGQLFTMLRDKPRCVLLNTVYSEKHAKAIVGQVECAIGMSGRISDKGAIIFARSFYEAIAYGHDVKYAYQTGCMALSLMNSGEQDVPVILGNSLSKIIFRHPSKSQDTTQEEIKAKTNWSDIVEESSDKSKPSILENLLNKGKNHSIFVGVNAYSDPLIPNLSVCVKDVTALHEVFADSMENAILLTDEKAPSTPTRINILTELSNIAQATDEDDLLLFYFSGHGMAERGESYLLSNDVRLSALKYTSVALRDVREIMDTSPARAKVIILDACHSGAAIGKDAVTMTQEFIQHVFEKAEGIAVLSSCKQGQKSWEWSEKNCSVFTYFLLEALNGKGDFEKKGFVTVSDVNRYVTDGVKKWSMEKGAIQTPTLQAELVGDIILVRL